MEYPTLREKRLFLLDMDGTIYLGDRLFDGTHDFLRHVREIGGEYLFLTNNSSRGVTAYVEKMARLGIETKTADFLTSTDALLVRLERDGLQNTLLYAFGTASFRKQLAEAGFSITDRLSDEVGALVCGFDTELTFQKLEDACILLNRGLPFYATNPDWVCPTSYGFVPDCGSVCEMLFRATGRRPIYIGKPAPEMVFLALDKSGFSKEQTLLIGDRLYTDIACGCHAGIDTALVLTGESSLVDVSASPDKPSFVFEDIRALLNYMTGEIHA